MMKKRHILVLAALLSANTTARAVSFNEDIRPILADRCFACHGPDSAARKADLRLDLEESAKAPIGDAGVVPIIAGNPGDSAIVQRLSSHDPDEIMPPPESRMTVSPAEIALIREWISEGAKWERHWAFIPPVKSPLPQVSAAAWPRNEIDHFIGARLESEGLKPTAPANRAQLLRRLSFDLTGLPPSIAELDQFLSENTEQAYERAVDRLIASPAFGERLALDWLDVARYGDTDGLFEDHPRSIYPWRDWVVEAFNLNLPYSDFISWQLAGDLMPDASIEQKIATGFLRNNPTSNEGGIIDEDYRIKYLIDRVNNTSTAFLGLTMECSQCHDHKFDPMTQREYYQMGGFFNNLVGKGNTKGSTAPTLKMLPPDKEDRLAAIAVELTVLDKTLAETPPVLLGEFEKWVAALERPVDWQQPKIISNTLDQKAGGEVEKARGKESAVRGRYVRLALPEGKAGFMTLSEVEVISAGRNVARAGVATQSSVGYQSPAQKAIDGNSDGSFASCSCTDEEADAWWEIDLGAEMPIDHIVVSNRNDCCPERLDMVSVSVLGEGRKPAAEHKIGAAAFRNTIVLNADAPMPKSESDAYEIVLEIASLAALKFSAERPGSVDSLSLEVLGEGKPKPRQLKIVGDGKFKLSREAVIVGLEVPAELAPDERLKVSIVGDAATISATADKTAAERAQIPEQRDQRLDRFRETWQGFASERKEREALIKEKSAIEGAAVVTMIASDDAAMRQNYILMRGEYDKPGEAVEASAPSSIMNYSPDLPKNRLGLARWMLDPDNPLTARVAVNRYWQMIFGSGIVLTSEDFGTQGDRPCHQALLDFLAVEFIESGWDLKHLIRKMVLSATYRQASWQSETIAERDPGNRLLSHAQRQRLGAEFVRDHALAVSGLLVDKRGGPGVKPYQPAVLFGRNAIGSSNASFELGTGEALYRRSLYTYWKRQIPAANMRILGADGRTACRTRRERTNTPLQALVLLNDPQFVEAARALAERAIRDGGGSAGQRLAYAFRLSTSRAVTESELEILVAELDDRLREFRADVARAKAFLNGGGASKADPTIDTAELAAYAAVASLILNLDESISKS